MPYVGLIKKESGLMSFQTVRTFFEGYIKQHMEKSNCHVRYKFMTLAADVVFVNGNGFMIHQLGR